MARKRQARRAEPNDRKFRELVLYLASKSVDDPKFSQTKLNKLLYFADFWAYRSLGESITGHRYQKLPYGPAPVRFVPLVDEMLNNEECEREERAYFGRKQLRLVALREPDLEAFSGAEVELIDEVLATFRELNAKQISEVSHREPGWQGAAMQEEIPYETIFVREARPLTSDEIEFGQRLVVGAGAG